MTIATESPSPRRLLLINPNTTSALTQTITRFVQAALPSDVVVESVTARFGAPYIATEVGYAVAAHAALDAWTRAQQPAINAAIIGCFGDPGLFALREVAPCPVTGLAEAALMEAATYGTCAVITGGHAWGPILERLLPTLEGGHTVRDIHTVELDGAALYAAPDAAEQILIGACTTVLRRQPVDAIVLGGAGLAGLAQKLQPHVPAPLIDSVTAAARQVWHAPRGGHGVLPEWIEPATHA